MSEIMRILITPGEPAGIGPDVTVQIAQEAWPAELIAIADPLLLQERAKQIGLPLECIPWHPEQKATLHQKKTLKVLPVSLDASVAPGKLNKTNAAYVIHTLENAASLCEKKAAHAIVTGPVHKGILNDAGIAFTGHTEFFAHHAGVKHTVMLFVIDDLKIALATTHLPLSDVPKAITKEKLRLVLSILNRELTQLFRIASPRIAVCGLNPHAGENGHLGREEIDVIEPLLVELRKENYAVTGPLPADTIFTPKQLAVSDAILAMYHDQALPVVKYIGFDHAVNVTLGLPFIRTSVDHGTALDIAGTNNANPGSMLAAINLALKLGG